MKSITFAVLRQLADGHFHSGEEMAQQFGCSRTRIWQAVNVLQQDLQLVVFKVRGHGYRLAQPFDWLDEKKICQALSPHAAKWFTLSVIESTDSTNTQLVKRATQGGCSGAVLVAEQQTAGKGRLGRTWQSRLGDSLTFSILWRFNCPVAQLAGLSLAIGVGLTRALRSFGVSVQLKWPNDLLLHGGKLAGVLIELSGEAQGAGCAVIGVGLNIRSPGKVDQAVSFLEEAGCNVKRNALLALLLNELGLVLTQFEQEGFPPFLKEWMAFCVHQDQAVRVSSPYMDPVVGIVRGVSETGALLLEIASGIRAFHAGEISLRS